MALKSFQNYLTEAKQQYLDMYRELLNNNSLHDEVKERGRGLIKDQIDEFEKKLGRNDRIVWFIRLHRVATAVHWHVVYNWISKEVFDKYEKELHRIYPSMVVETDKISPNRFDRDVGRIYEKLTHFLSLNIPAINNLKFDKQWPYDIFKDFERYEQEWQEKNVNRLIPADSIGKEVEEIVHFSNGWAWFDLGKEYCEQEGDKMRHCGNKGGYMPGDRVLSLREPVKEKGVQSWRPHLTFTIDAEGYLNERKGFANSKPGKRFHSYIAELLKQKDIIKGIGNRSYRVPAKGIDDFYLHDLSDKEIKEVLAANPNILNTIDQKLFNRIYSKAEIFASPELLERFLKPLEGGIPGPGGVYRDLIKEKYNPKKMVQILMIGYKSLIDNTYAQQLSERLRDRPYVDSVVYGVCRNLIRKDKAFLKEVGKHKYFQRKEFPGVILFKSNDETEKVSLVLDAQVFHGAFWDRKSFFTNASKKIMEDSFGLYKKKFDEAFYKFFMSASKKNGGLFENFKIVVRSFPDLADDVVIVPSTKKIDWPVEIIDNKIRLPEKGTVDMYVPMEELYDLVLKASEEIEKSNSNHSTIGGLTYETRILFPAAEKPIYTQDLEFEVDEEFIKKQLLTAINDTLDELESGVVDENGDTQID